MIHDHPSVAALTGLRMQPPLGAMSQGLPTAKADGTGVATNGPFRLRLPATEIFTPNRAEQLAALNAVPLMLWSANADGRVDFYNDRCREFLGMAPGAKAAHWATMLHPADGAAALEQWQQCKVVGAAFEAECRLRRHDGEYRWALCRAAPDQTLDGPIRGWTGSFTDIDDLKRGLEQSALIASEMAHRIQNIFAVAGALLMLSARTEPHAQSFANAARARLGSLARAHDVISPCSAFAPRSNHTTTVHELLRTLLAPYQQAVHDENGSKSIEIAGTDCPISGEAVISLALLVHELASNALKHGALTAAGGVVHVTTHLCASELHIVWAEAGGPPLPNPPFRRGFGTTLFERAVQAPAGSRLVQDWAAGGLIATLHVPRSSLNG